MAKTALIIGGAGRRGAAIARRLARDGFTPILADRDAAAARARAAEIGGGAQALLLDATDGAAVRRAVADLTEREGPVAALVNAAAGGAPERPFSDSDPASWRPVIDLHLKAVLNAIHAVLPGMIAARAGGIVSLVAGEGLRGDPARPIFSTAKAAIIVLTEQLVRECQPHGIRVNCVLPRHDKAPIAGADEESVAAAVAFLLSEESRLTTGACLDASGGWALH